MQFLPLIRIKVDEKLEARRRAKMRKGYLDFYDESENLIPQRLDIPDYDATARVWSFAGSSLGSGTYGEGFSASTEGRKCCAGLYTIGL